MSGNIDPITLIFIVLAIVIALRLRSVLGRRDDSERRGPMDGYTPPRSRTVQREETHAERDNVVTLPSARSEGEVATTAKKTADALDSIRKYAAEGSELEKGLLEIVAADRSFDPDGFVKGAKTAYEMIVMAFAEGNRKLLKQLLSKEVFDGFNAAIDEREKRQLMVDSSFVGISKTELIDARLRNGRTARITVRFVSSLITATHDRDGNVVDGDPKKVSEVTDLWTFSREASSRDPNWQLVATEAAA
jgi:predicted lipid-binding transport protein (Tim44 family)